MTRSILCLVALCTLLSACLVRHGDFTVLTNKLVRLSEFDLSKSTSSSPVEGVDRAHIILVFPTKANATLEDAVDDALTRGGGDVMTDATVHYWFWYIPYIYGQEGWSVSGNVVKTRRR